MSANRYPGVCVGCGCEVGVGEGVFDGSLWCAPPSARRVVRVEGEAIVVDTFTCPIAQAREALATVRSRERHAVVAAARAADPERLRAERERIAEDQAWAQAGLVRCRRCGGAGGREEWPGRVCFDCGGAGTRPAAEGVVA